MAIFHYNRKIGKRSEGKNAVFAVAYIRGEKRTCHTIQQTKDFSKKNGVIYKNCFLPNDAPLWAVKSLNAKTQVHENGLESGGEYAPDFSGTAFSDYAWNLIEVTEKRCDSQLYFHDDLAIPIELSKEAAIDLIENFVKNVIAVDGIFCDVAIHWDENNPHAHIVIPQRKLTEEGFSKKIRFTKKQFSDRVKFIREQWSVFTNAKFKELDLSARIDHRSYKDRGLNIIPTRKIGKPYHFQNDALHDSKVATNHLISAINFVNCARDPSILAKKLSQENMRFNDSDVHNLANKYVVNAEYFKLAQRKNLDIDPIIENILEKLETDHSIFNEKTIRSEIFKLINTPKQYQIVLDKVLQDSQIISLGLGEDGRNHYISRQAFELEKDLSERTLKLIDSFPRSMFNNGLNRVAKKFNLNESQTNALHHLNAKDLSLVVGFAGSGKTYMLKAANEIWEKQAYTVHGIAFSGKAAASLEADSGMKSSTISSFLWRLREGHLVLGKNDVVVMDEMGMTSLDDMQQVIKAVEESGAQFKGIGSVEQTQPIGRGAPMRAMIDQVGAVKMDVVLRQRVEWQVEATVHMETHQTKKALKVYHDNGRLDLKDTHEEALAALINKWHSQIEKAVDVDFSEYMLIAHQNQTVEEFNKMARVKLVANGSIEQGIAYQCKHKQLFLAAGDRIVFNRNDAKAGVKNGEFATIISIENDTLLVKSDDKSVKKISLKKYNDIDYGYAATVHKLQGYTSNYSYLYVDGMLWDRHLFLVGASRHREDLKIVASRECFENYDAINESVCRQGLKDHIFDFPINFAIRRGFDKKSIFDKAVHHVRKAISNVHNSYLYLFNYQQYCVAKAANPKRDESPQAINERRLKAIQVADFSDNRLKISEKLKNINFMSASQKDAAQKEIYEFRLMNGEIATKIVLDHADLNIALAKNRISKKALDAAINFNRNHKLVQGLVTRFKNDLSFVASDAYQVDQDIRQYYGHLLHLLEDNNDLKLFLNELKKVALQHRYDEAFEEFGMAYRAELKVVMQYLNLDRQISFNLKLLKEMSKETIEFKKLRLTLHHQSNERLTLANQIHSNPEKYNELIIHFNVCPDRLDKFNQQFLDRKLVKKFSQLVASTDIAENYVKQQLAAQIKREPKRFGIYVNDGVKEGWKSVNLENWRLEKRKVVATSAKAFKESLRLIKRYKCLNIQCRESWQKAFHKKNKKSPNSKLYMLIASYQQEKLDGLASEIVSSIEKHSGALTFEKIKLDSLLSKAKRFKFYQHFKQETNQTKNCLRAHYISQNRKEFNHFLAIDKSYVEVQLLSKQYEYLKRVKSAPTPVVAELIRLLERYEHKKKGASQAWRELNIKTNDPVDWKSRAQAKSIRSQRNKLAHEVLSYCKNNIIEIKTLEDFDVDVAALEKASHQYLGEKYIAEYLAADKNVRGPLAQKLLADRSFYHLIFAYGLSFKELTSASKDPQIPPGLKVDSFYSKSKVRQVKQFKRFDADKINQTLMADPHSTYQHIFGEPKKRSGKELRYGNGLVVTLTGKSAGKWYSFTHETGGTPVNAIQFQINLSFKEALAEAARLAGHSDYYINYDSEKVISKPAPITAQNDQVLINKQKIISAQSIWEKTVPIKNTLAEKYFNQHRRVTELSRMNIKFWPVGSTWAEYDEHGKKFEKVNKIPAAIIPVISAEGVITGVQRIYLDAKTANKNTWMSTAKLSKGIIFSSAGVVQTGVKGGALYVVEGPETGASIASIHPNATVLASLSIGNLGKITEIIKSYQPHEVIIAGDNDGAQSKTMLKTIEVFKQIKNELSESCQLVHLAVPPSVEGKSKIDWNDVLVMEGKDGLAAKLLQSKLASTISVESSRCYESPTLAGSLKLIVDDWAKAYVLSDVQQPVLIATNKDDCHLLNAQARQRLVDQKQISQSIMFNTAGGFKELGINELIVFTAAFKKYNIPAQCHAVIKKICNDVITVKLSDGKIVKFSICEFNKLDYGYATTVEHIQNDQNNFVFGFKDLTPTQRKTLKKHQHTASYYFDTNQISDKIKFEQADNNNNFKPDTPKIDVEMKQIKARKPDEIFFDLEVN